MGAIEFLGAQEKINVLVAQEDARPPRELTRITSEVWLWRSLSTTGGKPVYSIDNMWTRIGSGCPHPTDSCENTWLPNPDNWFTYSDWNPDNLPNWDPNGLRPGSSGPALEDEVPSSVFPNACQQDRLLIDLSVVTD
ncbi:unnamed protein product [Microthlaspi erraticum]|uniref:Uncharacterized protein n=1 Tax=Microthlaspi erraticum TaxID=1685480 RepID=A0A6D2HZB6_9BRAS|nr:unnamed protein product [Microthlaspi erraticum]